VDLVAHGNAVDHNQVVRADYYRECLSTLNTDDYDFRCPESIFFSEPECSPYGYLYGNIKEYSPMTMMNRYIGHLDGRLTSQFNESKWSKDARNKGLLKRWGGSLISKLRTIFKF